MKTINMIAAGLGLLLALGMLGAMVAGIAQAPRRIAACEANGGAWTRVPTAGEYLPGGVPVYECKRS